MSLVYFHNPRCSKSREGLKILESSNKEFTVLEYLKTPLKKTQLDNLFKKLGKDPIECVRTKEKLFKELGLKDKSLSKKDWIETLVENPVLLERPILEGTKKAIIGRPPENIKELL